MKRTLRPATAVLAGILLIGSVAGGQPIPGALPDSRAALARGEWPAYAGTYASAKYSPLDQITRDNVGKLEVAWRWVSPDQALRTTRPEIGPSFFN